MLEMSASSLYRDLRFRWTETTHQERINILNHAVHWTCVTPSPVCLCMCWRQTFRAYNVSMMFAVTVVLPLMDNCAANVCSTSLTVARIYPVSLHLRRTIMALSFSVQNWNNEVWWQSVLIYNTIQYKTCNAPYVTRMLFVGAGMRRG